MNVNFYLHDKNAKKPTLIFLHFRYPKNNVMVFSTKQKINPKHWNDKKKKAKELKAFPPDSDEHRDCKEQELAVHGPGLLSIPPLSANQSRKKCRNDPSHPHRRCTGDNAVRPARAGNHMRCRTGLLAGARCLISYHR